MVGDGLFSIPKRRSKWLKRFARLLKDHQLPESVSEIGVAEARQFIAYLQTGDRRREDSMSYIK